MHDYRLNYTGIRVKDMDESLRFYTVILGMRIVDKRERAPPTHGEVATLKSPAGDQLLELNWYAEGSRFSPPYVNGEDLDHLGFDVDDLDAALAELSGKGVEVVIRPSEIGGNHGWREAFESRLRPMGSHHIEAPSTRTFWTASVLALVSYVKSSLGRMLSREE